MPGAKKPATTAPSGGLARCAEIQAQLTRAQALSRKWEDERRVAVRRTFEQGIGAAEIAATLQISRAKVYQLIGQATRSKPC
jgi:DNA-directed RNA polymerase specialized sigma subunit